MPTRKYVMPLCLGRSGSVRARQIAQSACAASEVHTFWPVIDQPPSTLTAFVRSEARSEPASGSLKSWHHVMSPRSVGSAKRLSCAAVPWAAIAGTAQLPIAISGLARPAMASSSSMASCSAGLAPSPYGGGQDGAT